jgi:alanyl-tRNA synthetase
MRATRVPIARRLLRRAIVFLRDQTAKRVLLIKIINALIMKKERFEPMGFI